MQPQTAPFGSWRSPISAAMVSAGAVDIQDVSLDGDDVYWTEQRPAEGGRVLLVRRDAAGSVADVTPEGYDLRTRVHEYGGRCHTVNGGTVFFSHLGDGRIYRQQRGRKPEPITPPGPWRFADLIVDHPRRRLICVLEDHGQPGSEPANMLVSVPWSGGPPVVLAAGHDFYASPALSPDGRRLAWLVWDHPDMPWDSTQLMTAEVTQYGDLLGEETVAGGTGESIFQPRWSPDGELHFVSDRSGWWNLYRRRQGQAESLQPMPTEFGVPQWVFGLSTYAFASAGRLVCTYCQGGFWHMAEIRSPGKAFHPLASPYTHFRGIAAGPGRGLFVASSAAEPPAVVERDLDGNREQVLHRPVARQFEAGYLSSPQAIEFPAGSGQVAHGFFYPPRNSEYRAPAGERPPLLVISHGGPTGAALTAFRPQIQYWTSRGFAVLDVDYRGSTGYGRAYRDQINGAWGVADVDDCLAGARYLVEHGQADGRRLAITGRSAGGYTTLCALTFHHRFAAGASYYGIGQLEALVSHSHKFESHYLERLVGPYPQARELYFRRSPINFVDRLACPLILFQGLEDPIVPPAQSLSMFEAIRAKGLPVAYLPFPGEGHGFRRAESIRRALEAELYFYARVFDLSLAEEVEPVPIANLS